MAIAAFYFGPLCDYVHAVMRIGFIQALLHQSTPKEQRSLQALRPDGW
jgi:hypothetical protein